jgi:C-terminal processing protease CtpA/Prc
VALRNSTLFRALLLMFVFAAPAAFAQTHPPPPEAPTNLDFEQGQPGEVPPGWSHPQFARENGYTAKIVTDRPQAGKQAAEVALEGAPKNPRAFGSLLTTFNATPYRGKRVRFRAAVRVEPAKTGGQATLWMRVDREGGSPGFFDNMEDRPIQAPEWKTYEINGTVAQDAKAIYLGMVLHGGGRAWIDSASFEVLGDVVRSDEAARPLSPRGLENLTAFARLFGYVRYFHPSDQAVRANWERMALAGVQAVEKAGDAAQLARSLEDFFRPVAPTVRVFATAGSRPPLPEALKGAAGAEPVWWEHNGVQLNPQQAGRFRSERVSGSPAPTGGEVMQLVEALPFRGKRVTLRVRARAEVPAGAPAVLRLKSTVNKEGATPAVLAEAKPALDGEWRTVEVSAEVPADAGALGVELGLTGGGRVWWDDAVVSAVGLTNPLENADFEIASYNGGAIRWWAERKVLRAGYQMALAEGEKGGRALGLSYAQPTWPRPDQPLVADLGGGVSALVPLAVFKDAEGTLPHSPLAPAPATGKPEGFEPSGDDRLTRLADVVLAWNVFQHFYPYFEVTGTDWRGALPEFLSAAATDADRQAFLRTLRRMVARLRDGHGNVSATWQSGARRLPVLWTWAENQLVIARTLPDGAGDLRPGDVVVSLDGRPTAEALAAAEETVSGATPQWRRWVAMWRLAIGSADSSLKIEARHPDGTAVAATLKYVSVPYGSGLLEEPRPGKISELKPGIFYVNLDQVSDADFNGALDRLAAAKGIIFDLRGYPNNISSDPLRHLTDRPLLSARWEVPLVTRPDRQGWQWDTDSWFLKPLAPRLKGKIVFVTDNRAISYAETYMGIVEAYHLGEIVGAPTAGTNGTVNPFTLPGGYQVTWTGLKVTRHDGSRHHGVGIQPTVPAAPTVKGIAEGRDEVLEKALEVVSRP